jgi:hypothetical protein
MRRFVVLLFLLTAVSACTTSIVSGRPDYQQLLVTQRLDGAYVRAQFAAVVLGLQIASAQDTAHIFTARRPTGEQVTVTIVPSGFGCLVTFVGTPPHDVTDIARTYQQSTF